MPHRKTFANIVETTFNTPLVKLNRIVPAGAATVLLKLEFFNPLSSVKDRIGRAMIEAAEKDGHPQQGHPDHRTHQRQHGHCLGLRGRREGLPPDAHHARVDEPGTPRVAGDPGGEPGAHAGQGRHEGGDCQGPRAGRRHAQQLDSAAVRQSRQPGSPRAHHGPGDLGGHRGSGGRDRGRRGHGRHDHRRRPATSAPRNATSAPLPSSRPTRRSSPAASRGRTRYKGSERASSPRTSTPAC